MTSLDITKLLITHYTLSDLEFELGATVEDLKFGLEDFVDNYEKDIVNMFYEDELILKNDDDSED